MITLDKEYANLKVEIKTRFDNMHEAIRGQEKRVDEKIYSTERKIEKELTAIRKLAYLG